jgi:hypothetical protein
LYLVFFFSCDKNNEDEDVPSNRVALLKVDFLTNTFEGGKELLFSKESNFSIASIYKSPGDFGSVALYYKELNQKLFEGTIIWMGIGKRSYPENIDLPTHFSKLDTTIKQPDTNMFEKVMYTENAFYPETIDYESIWSSINDLRIVSTYRNLNPNGKIQLFLYTPSVGVGNPADWDWYVILKN